MSERVEGAGAAGVSAETDQIDWPCDNYTEPVTCLTARASETGQCRICRVRAADRLIAALNEVTLPTPHFGTSVYAEVAEERQRAHAKHGRTSMESQPADAPMRLSILVEEVGEVAKEFNEGRHRGEGPDLALLRAELIQVAAMAAAWADRLGYELGNRPGSSPAQPTAAPSAAGGADGGAGRG